MTGLPFANIDPIAFQFGPLVVRWYALAYIAGILLGWWYARRLIRQWESPVDKESLDDFVLWATVGIVVGGRLGYVLFYNLDQYLTDPIQILVIWQGGMSFHGGLAGVIVAAWLFARRRGFPILAFSDLIACAAPIGLFFGRIANFINGELYGRVVELPWAVVFPNGGPLPRHPSQLYEALLEGLVLFTLLAVLARRSALHRKPGLLSGVFLIGYGLARFAVEFVREPDAQLGLVFGPFSMGQALSAPLVVLGVLLFFCALATAAHGSRCERAAMD
jgi:phosphatidylglycerol---prolipoprotein diacylglyceryl transferase